MEAGKKIKDCGLEVYEKNLLEHEKICALLCKEICETKIFLARRICLTLVK